MSGEELLVTALLLGVIPLGVVEAVGYTRGGFMTEFWRSPLSEKVERIAAHRVEWALMGGAWVGIVAVVTAGIAGLAALMAEGGQAVAAGIGLSLFVVAATGWLLGSLAQTIATAGVSAGPGGEVPDWLAAVWRTLLGVEAMWIAISGLAYVALGIGILRGDLVGAWAGWAAIGLGVAVPMGVFVTREGFPHLALLVPLILAVALIVA